jgi:hypothetical protein
MLRPEIRASSKRCLRNAELMRAICGSENSRPSHNATYCGGGAAYQQPQTDCDHQPEADAYHPGLRGQRAESFKSWLAQPGEKFHPWNSRHRFKEN